MATEWSAKGAEFLPLHPLRTGREIFASSCSSLSEAPCERSRIRDGLISARRRVMADVVEAAFDFVSILVFRWLSG